MKLLALVKANNSRWLVFDEIPEITYEVYTPETEVELVEEGEIGTFDFDDVLSVPYIKKHPKSDYVTKIDGVETDRHPAQNPHLAGYDKLYIGTDKTKTFFRCKKLEKGTSGAFGGRSITIKMKNGSEKTFKGNLWDGGYQDAKKILNIKLMKIGAESIEGLKDCYVFGGYHINGNRLKELLDNYDGKVWEYREYEDYINS
jgi:hypothetical protein